MKKAIAYVRVSTDEQVLNGLSLEVQRHKLRAYGGLHELDIVAVCSDEGISGKRADNRPGLAEALAALKRGEAKTLVVVKLDRLSRSTKDVLELVERSNKEGWSLHSIDERLDTSSAGGRFVVTILAALAQMEREQISDRTKAALSHMRDQGLRISRWPPYGYRFSRGTPKRLLAVPREHVVISRIKKLHCAGHSCRAIAVQLNAKNIPTKKGQQWTHVQIGGILRRSNTTL